MGIDKEPNVARLEQQKKPDVVIGESGSAKEVEQAVLERGQDIHDELEASTEGEITTPYYPDKDQMDHLLKLAETVRIRCELEKPDPSTRTEIEMQAPFDLKGKFIVLGQGGTGEREFTIGLFLGHDGGPIKIIDIVEPELYTAEDRAKHASPAMQKTMAAMNTLASIAYEKAVDQIRYLQAKP